MSFLLFFLFLFFLFITSRRQVTMLQDGADNGRKIKRR